MGRKLGGKNKKKNLEVEKENPEVEKKNPEVEKKISLDELLKNNEIISSNVEKVKEAIIKSENIEYENIESENIKHENIKHENIESAAEKKFDNVINNEYEKKFYYMITEKSFDLLATILNDDCFKLDNKDCETLSGELINMFNYNKWTLIFNPNLTFGITLTCVLLPKIKEYRKNKKNKNLKVESEIIKEKIETKKENNGNFNKDILLNSKLDQE